MIPLGGSAGVLPRVPTNGIINGAFPLTIVKPPRLDLSTLTICSSPVNNGTPVMRILSGSQRSNSSASSLHSLIAAHKKGNAVDKLKTSLEHEEDSVTTNNARGLDSNSGFNGQRRAFSACIMKAIQREDIQKSESAIDLPTDTEPKKQPAESSAALYSNEPVSEDCKTIKQHQAKTVNRSSKKSRTKKTPKSAKPPRKKSSKKVSKKKSVFTRLSTCKAVGAGSSPENDRRNSCSMLFSKSNGNILNICKIQATYMPNQTPKRVIYLPKVPVKSNIVQNKASHNTPKKNSFVENVDIIDNVLSPRKVLGWSAEDNGRVSLRKVYLSEVQSKMLGGAPSAPPGTPTSDQLKLVEYIPSLLDIKSQRSVKAKLEKIEIKMKIDEQKKKEKAMKKEHLKQVEAIAQLKQRQREEIYALNKVMTQLENEKFRKFMQEKEGESMPV